MLVELAVRNLGVIAEARIPLGHGLIALTGETGAGKTMVVEALNLLLGGRPDPGRVRLGAQEAVVEGLFAVGDTEWVLRRTVPAEGRSRAYVNGELSTAAGLAELGASLLELHGQHAQQALLQPRAQRDALDRYAGLDRSELVEARRTVHRYRQQLAELGGDERARAREIDLLRFQLDEIDAVAPVEGEDEQLEREESVLADALAHRQAAATAVALLHDDGGAVDLLARAVAELEGRSPFDAAADRLRAVAAELSDAASELRSQGEAIEPDEERLALLRGRRQAILELRRKYGDTVAEVLEYAGSARERLEELCAHDASRTAIEAELATATAVLAEQARMLGARRRDAAPGLAAEVERHLEQLALPGARVEIVVEDSAELPEAGEAVELRLSVNAGAALGPISKVASGGELSRVMLALRLVLSDGPPTMVFDEVDAGIGGEAALAVGRALSQVGQGRQVLVVTHLPQVAAFADAQVLVAKRQDGHGATTSATPLDDAGRVVELSRMLSGSPDSATARDHANELLETAAAQRGRARR
jgi:DNA repair protein RecN (Recombination protein N)